MKHRVIHKPQDPLDIALVIPCYDEGKDILPLLYSAATQMHLEKTQIGIFFVINHGSKAPECAKISNITTAKLIIDILRNDIEYYTPEEQRKISRIQNSGIYLGIVDMFSQKGSPDSCNVGYARDEGTRAILPFLKNEDSVICHTDADCTLEAGYFWSIEQNFLRPEYFSSLAEKIDIATGGRDFKTDPRIKNNFYSEVSKIEEKIQLYVFKNLMSLSHFLADTERIHYTPGSHIIFRKGLFQEIAGFPHTAGAEDIAIGVQARQKGKKIHFISAEISTLSRISTRTQKGHGYGFDVERKTKGNNIHEIMTESQEHMQASFILKEILLSAHTLFSEDREKWENFVFKSIHSHISTITQKDISELANIYFSSLGGLNTNRSKDLEGMMPHLFAQGDIILSCLFPETTLGELRNKIENDCDRAIFLSTGIELPRGTIKLFLTKIELYHHLRDMDFEMQKLKNYYQSIQEHPKILEKEKSEIQEIFENMEHSFSRYKSLLIAQIVKRFIKKEQIFSKKHTKNETISSIQEIIMKLYIFMGKIEEKYEVPSFAFLIDDIKNT